MAEIALYSRAGVVVGVTLVDDEDREWLEQWTWRLSPHGYVHRFDAAINRPVYMAREILGLKFGDRRHADHINHDKMDNRRANLRAVTNGQNQQNARTRRQAGKTSRFRGVSFDKSRGRWIALAYVDGKRHFLGGHPTEAAAAEVVSAWRAKHMPFSPEARALAETP